MNNEPDQNPTETLDASKSQALQAAEELREAAAQKAREIRSQATDQADQLREFAEDRFQDARSQIDDLQREGERYVRKNPAKSVLIALGLGFVIGRIIR